MSNHRWSSGEALPAPTTPPTATRPSTVDMTTVESSTVVWTAERIRALGTVTTVPVAAAIFGLSRSVAYDLVKTNQFPVPVLRFGHRYRIPVAAILTALHLPHSGPDCSSPNIQSPQPRSQHLVVPRSDPSAEPPPGTDGGGMPRLDPRRPRTR
jgi:Helix-turn-helix domain